MIGFLGGGGWLFFFADMQNTLLRRLFIAFRPSKGKVVSLWNEGVVVHNDFFWLVMKLAFYYTTLYSSVSVELWRLHRNCKWNYFSFGENKNIAVHSVLKCVTLFRFHLCSGPWKPDVRWMVDDFWLWSKHTHVKLANDHLGYALLLWQLKWST